MLWETIQSSEEKQKKCYQKGIKCGEEEESLVDSCHLVQIILAVMEWDAGIQHYFFVNRAKVKASTDKRLE